MTITGIFYKEIITKTGAPLNLLNIFNKLFIVSVIAISYNNYVTCTPEHLAQQIREKGYRMTPQRFAILNILLEEGGHLFATDIYSRVQVLTPGLTEPTVYRTLEFLVENDLVRMTHTGNGKLAYELARHPHHHVKCNKCGLEQEILQQDMEKIYIQIENMIGYRLTETHLTFSGLCPACKLTGG